MRTAWLTSALALLVLPAGCGTPTGGVQERAHHASVQRGRILVQSYGCGACHAIPGVAGATGTVGPPLDGYAQRALLAGELPNTSRYLIPWIVDAPALIKSTGMPNLGVTRADASDIAVYLYTLGADDIIDWPPDVPLDRKALRRAARAD